MRPPALGTSVRKRAPSSSSTALKPLKDRIGRDLRVLFVGINPGIRSSLTGHHFAGYSNRFWKLLYESGLVPEPITYADDRRLPDWGFGITNLIPRPTPGIDTLHREEYVVGLRALRRKVRRLRPEVVAFVGVTLFRSIFARPPSQPAPLGLRPETFEGAAVFVLPNPSGRNANFSYAEMRAAFKGLARYARRSTRRA
ncbi:MAG TPA: mismatch-specific DNA-glycosylase [Vicinamibacterales bacterium]|nr:mismatch-specific DNA-glycosylase [Vicinamibacterales bacterium]